MTDSEPRALDRRLNAFRPDLADIRLSKTVSAQRYVEGATAQVIAPLAKLHPQPDPASSIDTEALFGETLRVFDRQEGWAWVQLDDDGYVGYLPERCLSATTTAPTHLVCKPRSFVYPGPDLRFPPVHALSMASRVEVSGRTDTRGTEYAVLADGSAMIAAHLMPVESAPFADPLAVAAMFLETPYLWGGRSGFGIDCSGLVQMALAMTGRKAPRDSDQQAAGLGYAIDPLVDGLRRGDLVFWKGHVGFLEDEHTLLHASGGTMTVTREPLAAAIDRIARLYGPPTGYRRP
ncbi:MAG: C40 family peptidase [Hoeflea sp.]|uniref:C40 family peptidase n=1 Tax=Hoeflea sp. TaxID=1940281 RepID=UPI0032EAB924